MNSWEWSKKDRIKTVEFIEKNNYLIDSTKMYNSIKYIKPNTIGVQAVDGFWTLSIYKFNNNHYFIVTNDVVGDGNDIQTFNFINNKLMPLKMINWFGEFDYKLLLNHSKNCLELLEDNQLTYDYDFSDKNIVKISSWLLTKKESEHCLMGIKNKIIYIKEEGTYSESKPEESEPNWERSSRIKLKLEWINNKLKPNPKTFTNKVSEK